MLVVNLVRSLILALALVLLGYLGPRLNDVAAFVFVLGCALTLADLAEQKLVELFDR